MTPCFVTRSRDIGVTPCKMSTLCIYPAAVGGLGAEHPRECQFRRLSGGHRLSIATGQADPHPNGPNAHSASWAHVYALIGKGGGPRLSRSGQSRRSSMSIRSPCEGWHPMNRQAVSPRFPLLVSHATILCFWRASCKFLEKSRRNGLTSLEQGHILSKTLDE